MAELSDDELQEAEVRMVSFMLSATFGYASKLERLRSLSAWNSDIFQVAYSTEEELAVLDLSTDDEPQVLKLGRCRGFSAVIPLTRSGFSAYMLHGARIGELNIEKDVVKHPYERGSVDFVALTGAVDFSALPQYLAGDRDFSVIAPHVLGNLARQIAGFLPPVEMKRTELGLLKGRTSPGRRMPAVLCPLSGVGMGQRLLETAGFEGLPGQDAGGNVVWYLDLEDLNQSRVEEHRFKQVFKANEYVKASLKRRLEEVHEL